MTDNPMHATSVAINGQVILLIGASGSGKSDLGLRLIDRGAMLISDDYTELTLSNGQLMASPPATIAGQMEVRHLGVVAMPHLHNLPVALAIRLDDKPVRMPDRNQSIAIMGVDIPILCLDAMEPSAPIKAELALRELEH